MLPADIAPQPFANGVAEDIATVIRQGGFSNIVSVDAYGSEVVIVSEFRGQTRVFDMTVRERAN